MALRETLALPSQCIDVRCVQYRITVAPEVIGPVLIGDEQDEIGSLRPHALRTAHNRAPRWHGGRIIVTVNLNRP